MGEGRLPHLPQIKMKPHFIELWGGGGGPHPCLSTARLTSWLTGYEPIGLGGRGRRSSLQSPAARSIGESAPIPTSLPQILSDSPRWRRYP